MRCLYCGKHLPLFRKLTGGGEFCSDTHREQYHEEYNRLAVSRLLQAQSRPEETKPAMKAPPPETPVAVAVEEEPVEVSASYVDEFFSMEMLPALGKSERAPLGSDPVFSVRPLIAALAIEPEALERPEFVPAQHPALFPFRVVARQERAGKFDGVPAGASDGLHILPALPERQDAECSPHMATALAVDLRPTPRTIVCEPLKTGVKPTELSTSPPLFRRLSLSPDLQGLPKAAALSFTVPPMGSAMSSLDVAGTMRFANLFAWRPAFDHGITLQPGPAGGKKNDAGEKVMPARVLKKLSQLQLGTKKPPLREPTSTRTLKPVNIPAMVPSGSVLATEFEAMAVPAKPQLLVYTMHPLRPKMAVGTASGPVAARSGGFRPTPVRKLHLEAPKILPRSILDIDNLAPQPEAPKITPKSMLHLDEEFPADNDNAADTASLFGKLGGLFGKRHKNT